MFNLPDVGLVHEKVVGYKLFDQLMVGTGLLRP